MFVRIMSDLHLEFENPFVPPPLPEDKDTVLVLAGDIGVGTGAVDWTREIAKQFRSVIYIAGNHEYYQRNNLDTLPINLRIALSGTYPNVHFLDRDCVIIGDVKFIGATLWTDYREGNPMEMLKAERCMNDFNQIRMTDEDGVRRNIHAHRILEQHRKDRRFIEEMLRAPHNGPVVVVTHHAPSYLCVHDDYKHSEINSSYASSLDKLIDKFEPRLWVYGHTHKTTQIKWSDKTEVVNNPFGYHRLEVNPDFDPTYRIDVHTLPKA